MTSAMPSGVDLISSNGLLCRSDLRDASESRTSWSDRALGGSVGKMSMKIPCKIKIRLTMYAAKNFAVESLL